MPECNPLRSLISCIFVEYTRNPCQAEVNGHAGQMGRWLLRSSSCGRRASRDQSVRQVAKIVQLRLVEIDRRARSLIALCKCFNRWFIGRRRLTSMQDH